MIRRILFVALFCLTVGAAAARRPAVFPFMLDARRILWIGAHPDDELLIAPLLGRYCVEDASACSLLVATRGENGTCALAGGCGDLGATREREMRTAAASFRATLTQWSLPDVMNDVESTWSRDEVIVGLKEVVTIERPTAIITFDPHHGSTCHPAHQAIGGLVLDAVAQLGSAAPAVYVVETRVMPLGDGYRFASTRPGRSIAWDARQHWRYLTDDIAIHASQFSKEALAALQATPDEERVIFVAHASSVSGPPYTSDCP